MRRRKSCGAVTAEACYAAWVMMLMCMLFVWLCGIQLTGAKIQNGLNIAATTISGAATFQGIDAQAASDFLQFSGKVTQENVTVRISGTVVEEILTMSEREAVERLVGCGEERWYCAVALYDGAMNTDKQQTLLALVAKAELFALYGSTVAEAEAALGKTVEELDLSASAIRDDAVWLTVRYPLVHKLLIGDVLIMQEERSVAHIWY